MLKREGFSNKTLFLCSSKPEKNYLKAEISPSCDGHSLFSSVDVDDVPSAHRGAVMRHYSVQENNKSSSEI